LGGRRAYLYLEVRAACFMFYILSHTNTNTRPSGITCITHQTQTPKRKGSRKQKRFSTSLSSSPSLRAPAPHHRLGRPPPPPSRTLYPSAASGCARGVPCRSTPSTSALNRTFHLHIRPPHPCFRAPALRRFALQGNEGLGVITQRMGVHIGTRTPHVPLANTEHLSAWEVGAP
jgi:hypothetical protein